MPSSSARPMGTIRGPSRASPGGSAAQSPPPSAWLRIGEDAAARRCDGDGVGDFDPIGEATLADLLTPDDFEARARERLTKMAYDYYRSGADEERTLADNRAAF